MDYFKNSNTLNRLTDIRFAYRTGSSSRTAGVAARCIVSIMSACMVYACGAQHQLINTSSTMDEIGKRVLAAVQQNDFQTLDAMRLTEHEFRTLVFPGLPIGKVKQWQNQYDFVWGDVNTKSTYCLRMVLARYGGQQFSFVKMKIAKGTTKYELQSTVPFWGASYIAHEDARVIAKDASGNEQELKLFGAVIEYNGHYKIMSFNTT
jgi:hypothetical protein